MAAVTAPDEVQPPVFATTHWSAVIRAGRNDSPAAREAMAELCRVYWYPLYAYARRLGHDTHTAQDLTQEFFGRLLEKDYLGVADRRRGKFRWFLLTAFKCFLANEWDRARAQKRGGGQRPLSLDELDAEQRYRLEPVNPVSADLLFDKRWALMLLERVRGILRAEYEAAGKSRRFELLENCLPGERTSLGYADAGRELGLSEGAVKVEVHRMKKRFGELLRAEIVQTVADAGDVDEEIRYLIDVVCRQ